MTPLQAGSISGGFHGRFMLSNITVPLVGVVDVVMMERFNEPPFIGSFELSMMVFD